MKSKGEMAMRIEYDSFIPSEHARRETLLHVANGYLGVRGSFEEGVPQAVRSIRGAYINGFYDETPIHYEERLHGFAATQQSMVNLPDVQGIHVLLDGEEFSCFSGTLARFSQALDTATGVSTRGITWTSPKGRTTRLVFRRLASLVMPQLFTIAMEAEALNWSGPVLITSTQSGDVRQDSDPKDPRKAAVGRRMLKVDRISAQGSASVMLLSTLGSGLSLASAVDHRPPEGFSQKTEQGEGQVTWLFTGSLGQGQPVTLTKYCIFADSRRHQAPETEARSLLDKALEHPFSHWAQQQTEALTALMRPAEARILGDEGLDLSLSFSMYSLLMSAGRDGVGNIASKGLSGEGYEGHYFWDTEIYMFPFFLLTNPRIAKALLISRARMLPGAQAHAREMGHSKGALYAWRTITGTECSSYYPSGSAQYHINADIAHAFLSFWRVTGDLTFMAETGLQVLAETARLWLEAGHYDARGRFRIDSVTGPDEYTCLVNNNYYTNKAAQHHLFGLCQLIRALEAAGEHQAMENLGLNRQELDAFERAANSMYLPFDEALGICAQDDSFLSKKPLDLAQIPRENFPLLMHYHPLFLYRHQVLKQADTVLSHFLFEEGETEDAIKNSYHYYEAITTHDSSLSPCVYAMMAARIGESDKALKYYQSVARLDLDDTHKNTADGIHAANMGGCWMGLVFGFAGLRIGDSGLRFRPCLPIGWQGFRFRFRWRESLAEARMDENGLRFTLLEGPSFAVSVDGKQQHITSPRPA